MIIKKTASWFLFLFLLCSAAIAGEEDFFAPNQLHGKITQIKLQRSLSPIEKGASLARFLLDPFSNKIVSNSIKKDFDKSIKEFVLRTVYSQNTFKHEKSVDLPFRENKKIKENLIEIVIKYIDNSPIPLVNNFKKVIKKAQSDLTENWLKVHSEKIFLEKSIATLYIDNYLKTYGKQDNHIGYQNDIDIGSDGCLFNYAFETLGKSNSQATPSTLAYNKPFFPIGVTIKFDANQMIEALKKSIYYTGNKKGILTQKDMDTLKEKENEISHILNTLKETGYPPKGAQIIFEKWIRYQTGDQWIGNKLLIAEYVLGREIK